MDKFINITPLIILSDKMAAELKKIMNDPSEHDLQVYIQCILDTYKQGDLWSSNDSNRVKVYEALVGHGILFLYRRDRFDDFNVYKLTDKGNDIARKLKLEDVEKAQEAKKKAQEEAMKKARYFFMVAAVTAATSG